MITAYIPGVWDLLHVGHLEILESAKELCDRLIVGVAADFVVEEDKGKLPIIHCHDRVRMLAAVRYVDFAVPYFKLEFLTHLEMFKPNILVVGEFWGKGPRHRDAELWAIRSNCKLVKLPYYKQESSTKIKQRILNQR